MTGPIVSELRRAGAAETEPGTTLRPATDASASRLRTGGADAPSAGVAWEEVVGDAPRHDGRPGPEFETAGVIGEGGMGRVFVAHQRSLGREVALKTTHHGTDEAAAAALRAESLVTGRLEHPGIVPVHALGIDKTGRPALVMKRIDGVAWSDLAQDSAHPGWEGWNGTAEDRLPGHLQILMLICNAVHFAHSRGIVHRDIKLDNVLIGRFGDAYLADWGIATPMGTEPQSICGTPGYMAPEMVLRSPIDVRTDVYLLGATLHHLLTGHMRHDERAALAAAVAASESAPHEYPDDVPRELGTLANLACHAEPLERPRDALAFRDALARYLEHRQAAALARESMRKVEQIEALQRRPGDAQQRREEDRLIAQASFGFERALADWSGNDDALSAQARLEALVVERTKRVAGLEREAHERDPVVGAEARTISLLVLGGCAVVFAVYAIAAGAQPSPWQVVAVPVAFYTVAIGLTVWLRKRLLANAFSRQVSAVVHVLFLSMISHRLLAIAEGLTVASTLARDGLVLAAGFSVAAILTTRWLWWVAATFWACFVACSLAPEYTTGTYSVSAAAVLFIAAWFQPRERKTG